MSVIKDFLKQPHLCNCIGPQGNDPVCPCRMSNLRKQNGRWVEVIDHGTVIPTPKEIEEILTKLESDHEKSTT